MRLIFWTTIVSYHHTTTKIWDPRTSAQWTIKKSDPEFNSNFQESTDFSHLLPKLKEDWGFISRLSLEHRTQRSVFTSITTAQSGRHFTPRRSVPSARRSVPPVVPVSLKLVLYWTGWCPVTQSYRRPVYHSPGRKRKGLFGASPNKNSTQRSSLLQHLSSCISFGDVQSLK